MKLAVFQSEEGDSLLLTSQAGEAPGGRWAIIYYILVAQLRPQRREGWIWSASRASTAAHIGGMLEDLVAWRRYDYHQAAATQPIPSLACPRARRKSPSTGMTLSRI